MARWLEITEAIQWLIDHGKTVRSSVISGYWKDTGNVADMLEVNRMVLETTQSRCDGTVDAGSEIIGRVCIESGAQVSGSRIVGPVIIGARSKITGSYVGPFTAVAEDCTIDDSEIEYSILLPRASIREVRLILDDHSKVQRRHEDPGNRWSRCHRLTLCTHALHRRLPRVRTRRRVCPVSGWLVTGAGGMLGHDLIMRLERDGEDTAGYCRGDLDITDAASVRATLRRHKPAVVINCAAWTAVDDAESHEDAALEVNGHAVAGLAAACADHGSTLVQVSTDYVFDGTSRQPYGEGDPPSPRTAYGRSKLAGEQAVLDLLSDGGDLGYVVRTAWLYGTHGPNFVRTMIGLEGRRPTVDVVDDQHGQPSWTVDVAGQIIALVRSGAEGGVYHATSSGETTWFGLAREIFDLLGADPARVRATTSSAFPRPAARPSYSVLGHDGWARASLAPIGDWRSALHRAFPGLVTAFRGGQPGRL